MRSITAWERKTRPILVPSCSACTMALTNVTTSGTSVRWAISSSASRLARPIPTSRNICAISSASGPRTFSATCRIAASRPSPASTDTVTRSKVSGRLFQIASFRPRARRRSHNIGAATPRAAKATGRATTVVVISPPFREKSSADAVNGHSTALTTTVVKNAWVLIGRPAVISSREIRATKD